MEICRYKKYLTINCKNLHNLSSLIDYLHNQTKTCPHIIINFLECDIDENIIISSLLPFYINWQKRNKSFILVSNIRKESLNDIVSIKSLDEAIDFFHMEELTRNI